MGQHHNHSWSDWAEHVEDTAIIGGVFARRLWTWRHCYVCGVRDVLHTGRWDDVAEQHANAADRGVAS